MKAKGSWLVREIVGHCAESIEIAGTFCAPFPVKEIFELRHSVLPVRTVVGNKCIAYFGEVEFKIYCISENDLTLRLLEDKISFKGFAFFEENAFAEHPGVQTSSQVLDVFVESLCSDTIKIFALLNTEVTLSIEKDTNSGETFRESQDYKVDVDSDLSGGLVIENLTIE